jgi:hypothetical protein
VFFLITGYKSKFHESLGILSHYFNWNNALPRVGLLLFLSITQKSKKTRDAVRKRLYKFKNNRVIQQTSFLTILHELRQAEQSEYAVQNTIHNLI